MNINGSWEDCDLPSSRDCASWIWRKSWASSFVCSTWIWREVWAPFVPRVPVCVFVVSGGTVQHLDGSKMPTFTCFWFCRDFQKPLPRCVLPLSGAPCGELGRINNDMCTSYCPSEEQSKSSCCSTCTTNNTCTLHAIFSAVWDKRRTMNVQCALAPYSDGVLQMSWQLCCRCGIGTMQVTSLQIPLAALGINDTWKSSKETTLQKSLCRQVV